MFGLCTVEKIAALRAMRCISLQLTLALSCRGNSVPTTPQSSSRARTLLARESEPPPRPHLSPEERAGAFSLATFGWLGATLRLGATRPLVPTDLPLLRDADAASAAGDAIERQWARQRALGRADSKWAVPLALARVYGGEFGRAGVLKLGSDICQITAPLLLKRTVGMLEKGANLRTGAPMAFALLLLQALQALCLRHYFSQVIWYGLFGHGHRRPHARAYTHAHTHTHTRIHAHTHTRIQAHTEQTYLRESASSCLERGHKHILLAFGIKIRGADNAGLVVLEQRSIAGLPRC